ncbi:hypothetical protein [Kushneria aurantia]|uniref:Uncharacterized protein n=1 Tax=Kushneria aurantia TaxID=504092 RepID=A0ABV6G5Y5_9GAMM|nr:hypothetical protein [Kushneria aurantia]
MFYPDWQQRFIRLWTLLRDTTLPACAEFALPQWREALAHFENPARIGKPMLVIDRL